jgi:hypothetical protein
VLLFVTGWLAPALEPLKVSPRVAAAVLAHAHPVPPVAAFDYADQGLDFYLGQSVRRLGTGGEVTTWLDDAGPGVLLITTAAFPVDRALPPDTSEVARVSGFDHSKGRFVDVRVLARGSASWEPR